MAYYSGNILRRGYAKFCAILQEISGRYVEKTCKSYRLDWKLFVAYPLYNYYLKIEDIWIVVSENIVETAEIINYPNTDFCYFDHN